MATTDVLQLVGVIAGALIAAGGSSLLVVSQYQTSQRKKQPQLTDASEWQKVISAQRRCLEAWDSQVSVLSSTRATKFNTGALTRGDHLDALTQANLVIQKWSELPMDSMTPILGLREGRKAFKAYRSSVASQENLKILAEREEEYHSRRSQTRKIQLALMHGPQLIVRRMLRIDAGPRAGRIIKHLLRAEKYLIEISYLQPSLLLHPTTEQTADDTAPA